MPRQLTFWLALTTAGMLPLAASGQEQEQNPEQEPEATEEAAGPTFTDYIEVSPAFVTHIGESAERPNYLKADVSLRVATETARAAIETHMPRLRHELVMLFGEQTDLEALSTPAGQEELRSEARARINNVLEEQQTGEQVVDVLFTTFVIQR